MNLQHAPAPAIVRAAGYNYFFFTHYLSPKTGSRVISLYHSICNIARPDPAFSFLLTPLSLVGMTEPVVSFDGRG
jgi:hypothetical protein